MTVLRMHWVTTKLIGLSNASKPNLRQIAHYQDLLLKMLKNLGTGDPSCVLSDTTSRTNSRGAEWVRMTKWH